MFFRSLSKDVFLSCFIVIGLLLVPGLGHLYREGGLVSLFFSLSCTHIGPGIWSISLERSSDSSMITEIFGSQCMQIKHICLALSMIIMVVVVIMGIQYILNQTGKIRTPKRYAEVSISSVSTDRHGCFIQRIYGLGPEKMTLNIAIRLFRIRCEQGIFRLRS